MTAIQAYEAVLIELNKVKAPSLSLNDFLYFFNKAIQQYFNLMYNNYEITQQKTDDLRVIKSTAILDLTSHYSNNSFFQDIYTVELPDDYVHILNCIIEFVDINPKCNRPKIGEVIVKLPNPDCNGDCNEHEQYIRKNVDFYKRFHQGVKRLTADAASQVINNHYLKPSYRNPYFYINTVNDYNTLGDLNDRESLNSEVTRYKINSNYSGIIIFNFNGYFINIDTSNISGYSNNSVMPLYRYLLKLKNQINISPLIDAKYFKDIKIEILDEENILVSSLNLTDVTDSYGNNTTNISIYGVTNFLIDKESYLRYGNTSKSIMEIRCGYDKNIVPVKVLIDYLKAPQQVDLTQDQIDDIEDNSQILEFPDYVTYEIINILVKLVLENSGNPRVQSHYTLNQSIPGNSPATQG